MNQIAHEKIMYFFLSETRDYIVWHFIWNQQQSKIDIVEFICLLNCFRIHIVLNEFFIQPRRKSSKTRQKESEKKTMQWNG